MKKFYACAYLSAKGYDILLFILLMMVGGKSWGQISLTNASPTNSQNFDAMSTGTTLPSNWRMAASTSSPTWSAASTSVTAQASSGSPTAGGTYNFGSSTSERAVGAMTSGSFASPNSLVSYYTNAGTTNITGLTIQYDAENYRVNTAAASIQFYYSLDGSTWTAVSAGDINSSSFPTGTSTYNFSTPATISKSGITISSLAISGSSSFYLRWTLNTTGANSQAIGIDNVSVTATFASSSTPSLAISGTSAHGSVCLGSSGSSISYTITNSGLADATGVSVTSSDPQFVVSGLSSTTITASGGTATYNVTFTPTNTGSQSSTITVSSTTAGSNSPTNSLTGTGIGGTPSAPTGLSLSFPGNAITGTFSSPSTAPTNYLVIRTTSSTAPTTPADGTTYTAGSTVLGGYIVSTSTSTGFSDASITCSTPYWYWVYSFNATACTGSPKYSSTSLNGNITPGSVTNTMTISSAGTYNWNTASNWSLGHVPSACEDVVISGSSSINGYADVEVQSNITINSLSITLRGGTGSFDKLYFWTNSYSVSVTGDVSIINNSASTSSSGDHSVYLQIGSGGGSLSCKDFSSSIIGTPGVNDNYIVINTFGTLSISGKTTASAPTSGSGLGQIQFNVGDSPASITFSGNATFDDGTTNSNSDIYLGSTAATGTTTGTMTFKGDVTFGAQAFGLESNIHGSTIFDGSGAQTVTVNTSSLYFPSVKIGSTNSPAFTLAGSENALISYRAPTPLSLSVNNSSVFDLSSHTLNVSAAITSTFSVAAGAYLKLGGTSGGQTGSNFPLNYSTNSLSSTSTVEYNGGTQTVYASPTYGHLVISSSGTKTAGSTTNIAGNLTISSPAIFAGGSNTIVVGGNWTNWGTGGFTESSSTVNFNGSGSQSLTTTGGEDFTKLGKTGSGTLTLGSNVTISGTGSQLNIIAGTLDAGTYSLSGSSSAGFVMEGGTLKMAKTGTTLPEFSPVSNYNISGGTIELYASGLQVLRGGVTYQNLTFSNSSSTTLSSSISTIFGTVTIANSAILDIASNSFANTSSANTHLTMTGGRFRMSNTGTSPVIDGTYSLTGGTIEFYNNSSSTRQTVKPKNAANSNIIYNNIDVNGSNVGQSTNDIYLNATGGTLTVKSGATFYMSNHSVTSNNSTNTSAVTVESGGTFVTSSPNGFSGGVSTSVNNTIASSNIFLNSGSTVEYTGSSTQAITNQVAYSNLTLSGTGTKTAPSGTLTVNGNFTKSSGHTFDANSGTVLFSGSGTQTITSTTPQPVFYDLTMATGSSVTVADSIAVSDKLQLTGTAALTLSSGNVTLKSSSTRTAIFGALTSGSISYTGTGRFIVERYITTPRKWQFLSTGATNGTQSFRDSWMEGQTPGTHTSPASTGYGMWVTDPAGTASGFDSVSFQSSVKYYDGFGYTGITNTSNDIHDVNANDAYMAFVRGDRYATGSNSISNNTVLRTKGKLNTNNYPTSAYSLDALGGTITIGNAYASPVDLSQIVSSSTYATTIMLWDPKLTSGYGLGAFQYLTRLANSTNFTISPAGATSSYSTLSAGDVMNKLESGQAFFITGADLTVQFKETAKTSSSNGVFFTAGQEENLYGSLSIRESGNVALVDGFRNIFHNSFNSSVDVSDARKLPNTNENISVRSDNKLLAVELRKPVDEFDTIRINLANMRVKDYRWTFRMSNMDKPGRTAFLIDKFTNTETPLDLTAENSYDFSVSSAAGSSAADRFMIVFRPAAVAGPLPVHFTSISATRNTDKTVTVKWNTENEINIQNYAIEYSADGTHFTAIGTQLPTGNNGGAAAYAYIDGHATAAANYYRIRANSSNGQAQFTAIAKVGPLAETAGINIFPNPVKDGTLNIRFADQPTGKYNLEVTDMTGRILLSKSIEIRNNSTVQMIALPANTAKGKYHANLINKSGTVITLAFVVE